MTFARGVLTVTFMLLAVASWANNDSQLMILAGLFACAVSPK